LSILLEDAHRLDCRVSGVSSGKVLGVLWHFEGFNMLVMCPFGNVAI